MKITRRDIGSKLIFKRFGYTYYQVFADHSRHIYIYEMMKDGKHKGYEVVKDRKYTNPDGRVVYTYPTDENICICIRLQNENLAKIITFFGFSKILFCFLKNFPVCLGCNDDNSAVALCI